MTGLGLNSSFTSSINRRVGSKAMTSDRCTANIHKCRRGESELNGWTERPAAESEQLRAHINRVVLVAGNGVDSQVSSMRCPASCKY